MAAHVEKSEIDSISPATYARIRSQLRSGDLLFASGDYLISKLIQHFTGSPWSHVGMILRAEAVDRVLLLESVEDVGVRFAPLSKYLEDYEGGRPYKGRIVVARFAGVDKDFVKSAARFGIDELTRPYDKDEIAKIVGRIALGIGRKQKDREYICSELVFECFLRGGKEFAYDKRGFISPENIWIDPGTSLQWRLA
ncbi:MAG: hypothetical protein L0Z55_07655 [Planctomycetes bacterium]|nr:hypothetical protein [Planctomycetota bacterium]